MTGVGGVALLGSHVLRPQDLTSLPGNSVGAVTADGSMREAVLVGADPAGVAYADGTLWVTGGADGRVTRVDLDSHRVVQTVPVGRSPTGIAVLGADVWVANSGDGTVSRVNSTTNTVVQTVKVGALPTAIAAGPSGVWVANGGGDSVQRIDPRTGVAGRAIGVGSRPAAIALGNGTVWVANGEDGTVSRVDARTGEPTGGPIPVGSGPSAVAVSAAGVWVANSDDQSVDRLDPRTGALVAHVRVGDGPSTLAVAGATVWVGNSYDGTVTRIDAATNSAGRRVATGASPRSLVVVGADAWVASSAFADPAHRGGTLTVSDFDLPGSGVGIDPSNEYLASWTLRALRLVYDGLVAYRVGPGVAGMRVVPDLAEGLPRPSDGGRTYAFTLRPGIKFSDGSVVQASDIRRGVLRALTTRTFPGGPAESVGIVGAERCGEPKGACDLSRGVVIDDSTGSIVFHLRAPDPDFLLKLVFFGAATQASAPATEATTPLLGTGPYRISEYRQGSAFVLTRNPYFTQWSFAAQPQGYADTIRWLKVDESSGRLAAALTGRADVVRIGAANDPVLLSAVQDAERARPAQFHTENPFSLTHYYLNPHARPFDDIRVRRALNLAIDRTALAAQGGGPGHALPTCQMLPPNFPGYQPYCPFSTGPPAAPYAGPDLREAKRLVAASGTKGTKIVVTSPSIARAEAEYIVGVLRSLGYAASADLKERGYFSVLTDRAAHLQMIRAPGWSADYAAASNFYFNVFSCSSKADPGLYVDRWCDNSLDALATKAYQAEGTDPGTARADWEEVDRRLTDSASFVALLNHLEALVVSKRVGNFQSSPFNGPLLSQIWVR